MSNLKIISVDNPILEPMPFTDKYRLYRAMEVIYVWGGEVKSLVVPESYLTDGATIPKAFWVFIGTPYSPKFITGAVIHDRCYELDYDVAEMSELFLALLRLSDVPSATAELMRKGVYAYTSKFKFKDRKK